MSKETTLYRKYRPQQLNDIVGQNHVTQTIKNAFLNDTLPHAFLFTGTRGCGKTTAAKILAKLVNCINPADGEPCNKCKNCVSSDAGSNPDIVEMDAASNRGIENMRDLTSKVDLQPSFGKKRVYIIDEVHMLTTESFNALLKTLEEPPNSIIFILATTEVNKVISTITSRCQIHNFKRISIADTSKALENISLKEADIKLEESGARAIAINSGGSLRDAISKLQQIKDYANGEKITAELVGEYLGTINSGTLSEILELVLSKEINAILNFVNTLDKDGVDLSQLVTDFEEYLRKVWLTAIDQKNINLFYTGEQEKDTILKQSQKVTPKQLMIYIELLEDAMIKLKTNAVPRIIVETTLTKMAFPELDGGMVGIKNALSKLEKKINKLETVLDFFKNS